MKPTLTEDKYSRMILAMQLALLQIRSMTCPRWRHQFTHEDIWATAEKAIVDTKKIMYHTGKPDGHSYDI